MKTLHFTLLLAMGYILAFCGCIIGMDDMFGPIISISFFSIYSFLPMIFLHYEYYRKNLHDIFEINVEQKFIRINDSDSIPFKDVKLIILYMPSVWHRKGFIRIFPSQEYRFAKIEIEGRDSFIFTSLMAYNLEEVMTQITDVHIEKKIRYFATTLFC